MEEKREVDLNSRNTEQAQKEKAMLKELNSKPWLPRTLGYIKLSGLGNRITYIGPLAVAMDEYFF